MKGIIAVVLLLHCCISILRLRRYAQSNDLEYFIPIDIIVEISIGLIFAVSSILVYAKGFKPIKQFTPISTYDAAFLRKNFKDYSHSRAMLLRKIVIDKIHYNDITLRL